jgi:hypothetical protein
MICYLTKYKYISNFELDFLDFLKNLNINLFVYPQHQSNIKNTFYLFRISSIKFFEKNIQRLIKPSRHYQELILQKINEHNYKDFNFPNTFRTISLYSSGFVIKNTSTESDLQLFEVIDLIYPLGIDKYNSDQTRVSIRLEDVNSPKNLFVGSYDRDKLQFNNNIIILRTLLNHLKNEF